MPPHVLMNFRGFPPGCGDSVADFWGWDAHGARLGCPDDVSGDMQEDEISGGTLSLNLLTTQTMVTTGIFFPARKNSHGRTENRTRDLMISSQRPWSLDHEAGLIRIYFRKVVYINEPSRIKTCYFRKALERCNIYRSVQNRSYGYNMIVERVLRPHMFQDY